MMTQAMILPNTSATDGRSPDHSLHDQQMINQFFPKGVHRISDIISAAYRIHKWWAYQLCMKVLSFSIRKKLRARDHQFYKDGRHSTVKVGKVSLELYSYGQGPAVLLLHGWCSNGAHWRNYVPLLVEAGYQAVVVDAPGHGTASGHFFSVPQFVDSARHLLQQRKWSACITHSMGSLATGIAIGEVHLEQRPDKLVMMNTFSSGDTIMTKFLRCLGIKEQIIKETKERYIPRYHNDHLLSHYSLQKHAAALPAETLLIYDDSDIVVPPCEPRTILTQCPTVTPMRTHGLGHNLRSKRVEEAVMDFIL